MAMYKNSEHKKELILNTCKELFYNKGYAKTTYKDICEKLNIQPTAVTYYFNSKAEIAADIYREMHQGIDRYYKKIIRTKKIDAKYLLVLEIIETFNMLKEEPRIRKFSQELYSARIPNKYFYDVYQMYYTDIYKAYKIKASQMEIAFNVATSIGLESEIIIELLDRYPIDFLIEHYLIVTYDFVDVHRETVQKMIEDAREIYSEVKMKKEYFHNFNHNDILLI